MALVGKGLEPNPRELTEIISSEPSFRLNTFQKEHNVLLFKKKVRRLSQNTEKCKRNTMTNY